MVDYDELDRMLEKTTMVADADERQARTERIMRDPRPQYAPPVAKPYPTTELHYILCADPEAANQSMPEAAALGSPHKLGGILASDRLEVPAGWVKQPSRGLPVSVLQETHPALYQALVDQKVTQF